MSFQICTKLREFEESLVFVFTVATLYFVNKMLESIDHVHFPEAKLAIMKNDSLAFNCSLSMKCWTLVELPGLIGICFCHGNNRRQVNLDMTRRKSGNSQKPAFTLASAHFIVSTSPSLLWILLAQKPQRIAQISQII